MTIPSGDRSLNQPGRAPPTLPEQETTGNFWTDLKIAFQHGQSKRLSPREDFRRLEQIPCARNSLMSGIASGVGLGVVRALSTSLVSAFHWSMGTFIFISMGTWTICQRNLRQERALVHHVVEQQAKRRLKRPVGDGDNGVPTQGGP